MKQWNFDFYKNRKKYYAISLILIAALFVGIAMFGISLDIQFKGGVLLTYSYDGEIDSAQFSSIAKDVLGEEPALQESTDLATGKKNFVLSLSSAGEMDTTTQQALNESLQQAFPDYITNKKLYELTGI